MPAPAGIRNPIGRGKCPGHGIPEDYKAGPERDEPELVDPDAPQTWKCSACGSVSEWTDEHRWYGAIECKSCWHPVMHYVVCSDECRREMEEKSDE